MKTITPAAVIERMKGGEQLAKIARSLDLKPDTLRSRVKRALPEEYLVVIEGFKGNGKPGRRLVDGGFTLVCGPRDYKKSKRGSDISPEEIIARLIAGETIAAIAKTEHMSCNYLLIRAKMGAPKVWATAVKAGKIEPITAGRPWDGKGDPPNCRSFSLYHAARGATEEELFTLITTQYPGRLSIMSETRFALKAVK